MVKSTTDLFNKSAVIEIAETADTCLQYFRDLAPETKILILGNQKNMEELVIKIANISEVLTYEGLNLKDRRMFLTDLLPLEEQKHKFNIVSFIERNAQLLKTFLFRLKRLAK